MRALLNYEAPEFQDSGVVSERGDVYSFGVVMLELLTGRKPWDWYGVTESKKPNLDQYLFLVISANFCSVQNKLKMAFWLTYPFYVKIRSSRPRHEQHLVRWARSQLHDIECLSKMVDRSIRGQCSEKALSRFADIISRCIQVIQFCFLLRPFIVVCNI